MTGADLPQQRAKVIGRILSLGFPLPGTHVDNYTFLSAPAFFDYDAIVVDPLALSQLVAGVIDGTAEATTFADAPVRLAPAAAGDVALADVLLRRRDETQALLERGGGVVCFAYPPEALAAIAIGTASRPPAASVATREQPQSPSINPYFWLPTPEGVEYAPPFLITGDGTQAQVVDFQHPLAAFLHQQLASVSYRSHFDATRLAGGRVFARSRGGAAIAIEVAMPAGRVIFLPAMKAFAAGDARYAMSDALQAGILRALGVIAEGRAPSWVEQREVPGLTERVAAVERARSARDDAQHELDATEAACDELARYQRLLWQEGALGLEDVVLDALRLIGFEVYGNDRENIELRMSASQISVLVEIDAGEQAIGLAPHYRLRQRIERSIERRSEAPRGLLIVNGFRHAAPSQREAEVSASLRVAAETMRYCIAPTSTLFAAVVAQLQGDDEAVTAYREQLLSTSGVIVSAPLV